MKLRVLSWTTLIYGCLLASHCAGMQNVWLDFNSDWHTSLSNLASSAAVADFSPEETTALETEILNAFVDVYDGYTINFSLADPGGSRERVDFGATNSNGLLLGQTTLDFRNRSHDLQEVFVSHFGFILEPKDDRSQQLSELARAVGGTAAHELGHSLGLRHFYAYGDTRISPANYGDTAGIQNEHIMATGSTGLAEEGRESVRTLSDWSKLQLELGNRLSNTEVNPLFELFVGDFGSTIETAEPLPLQLLDVSNAFAGVSLAELSTEADVDFYELDVEADGWLTAELWTGGGFYDGMLSLYDESGMLINVADNVLYSATTFGSGAEVSSDPWLLNIPVQPGTYYVEVGAVGSVPVGFGDYELTLGLFAVPEPSVGICGLLVVWAFLRRNLNRCAARS